MGVILALTAESQAVSITTGTPLTRITVTPQLQCQTQYLGGGQFWPANSDPAGCGTFLYVSQVGNIYGAIGCTACPSTNTYSGPTQTGPSGAGSGADPWRISTTANAGSTGVSITEVDTYVNGQGAYRTSVSLTNSAAAVRSGILWHAGDCEVQDDDEGYGWVDPVNVGGIACAEDPQAASGYVVELIPGTPGSRYYEAHYSEVRAAMQSLDPFSDICECAQHQDNGVGIAWQWSLQPGETAYFNYTTVLITDGAPPPPPPPPPPPIPPSASFVAFPNNPCGPPTVFFDASASNGGSGAIISYSWQWGDASGTTIASPTVSHTYPSQGTYTVQLTVTSSSGSHTFQFDVTVPAPCVIPPPNQAPVVDVSITAGSECQDSTIAFRSTASDPEGQPLTYLWTFSDGGPSSTLPQVDRVLQQVGGFTATLAVTDPFALTTTVSRPFQSYGDPNCCPTIQPLLNIATVEGHPALHKLLVSDFEGDPVTLSMLEGPAGATLTPEGLFRFDTVEGDAGTYTVTIGASDGCLVQRTFELIVKPPPPPPTPPDHDLDGWPDIMDNCPSVRNHMQDDVDLDGIGNACDLDDDGTADTQPAPPVTGIVAGPDTDGDAAPDAHDTCPALANSDQADLDRDGAGDACDSDIDGDRIVQMAAAGLYLDNCPMVSNAGQQDEDADMVGDACDTDAAAAPGSMQGSAHEAQRPARIDWGMTAAMVLGPLGLVAVVALVMMRGARKPRA